MADKEVETIDVSSTVGQTTVQPSFVQRAGLWLAAGVGSLIAIVTVVIIIFFWCTYPSFPKSGTGDTDAALKSFKELSELALNNAKDLFQLVVMQALLPVFTAILGYIFARSGRDSEN